jgi:hypothetical protein
MRYNPHRMQRDLDVSCIVIGEPCHVVCASHVVQSAVCPYVGEAAEGHSHRLAALRENSVACVACSH